MSGAVEGVDRAKAMLLGDEDTQGIRPQVTFADHSYPAYSKQQMIDFALLYAAALTTPPARSYADEDVARIIDWSAWSWHDRWLKEAETEKMAGRAASLRKDAKMHVAASLAKAASIRLLLQGGKA